MSRQRVIDVGVAFVVFVLTLVLQADGGVSSDEEARNLDLLGVVLAAGASGPLVVRRRAPLLAFVLTAVASALINGLHYPAGPPIGPMVALFFLGLSPPASRAGTRTRAAAVVALFVVHVVAAGIGREELPILPAALGAVVWGGAWVVGDRVRLRRERMAELEERARRAEAEAERERKLAAAEERTRIARDLHDSAGHAINVILVHAGAARLLAEKDPGRARAALGTIESVAHETLREIDQLVGALREDDERAQTPIGLAALDTLVKRHRDAGLEVDVLVNGDRRQLSPGSRPGRVPDPPGVADERHAPRKWRRQGRVDLRPRRAGDRGHEPVLGERRERRWSRDRRHARARVAPRRQPVGAVVERPLPDSRARPLRRGGTEMTERPVRVLLVDDDDLMRAGLRSVLSSDDEIEVVGEAGDGRAALDEIRKLRPDLVLMDIRMPDLDGISATREVLAAEPEIKVVVLTTFEEDDYIFEALSAGASGFLLKRTKPEELIAAIHTVADGDSLLSPSVTRRVIDRMAGQPAAALSGARLEALTPREREVLELVGRGLSNQEIAEAFFIEESTVKTHVKRILMKLGLRDRVQAVILAYETGVIRTGSAKLSR